MESNVSWYTIVNRGGFDVAVVGIPKSGTNATEKVVRLLGRTPSHHMHTPPREEIYTKHKVIYIRRNPRNVLISWLRYHERELTEKNMIDTIQDFGYPDEDRQHGNSMFDMYTAYDEWRSIPSVCVVRYEDLVQDQDTIDRIADYLNVPRSDGILPSLPKGTYTWNDKKSNWKEYWTDRVEGAWLMSGMPVIESTMGYPQGRMDGI